MIRTAALIALAMVLAGPALAYARPVRQRLALETLLDREASTEVCE